MAVQNLTQEITGITVPNGCRAVLVSQGNDGTYKSQPVEAADSVLNIKRDLLKHLNESPCSDEWLAQLRDYCDGRLAARSEARKGNGVIVPDWQAQWTMIGERGANHGKC